MAQPNFNEVHTNRPLTNISVAFMQNAGDFLAGTVFPVVPVGKASDTYRTYDRSFWYRSDAQRRAPGTESAAGGYGIGTASYACLRDAIHKDVDDPTRANADEPLNLDREATEYVTSQLMLKAEVRWAAKYFTTGVWNADTTPSVTWDDAASDPIRDIKTRARTMVSAVGGRYQPNTLVLGAKVYDDLSQHPDIIDRVKYTAGNTNPAIVNEQALAALFGVQRVLVSRAVENTAAEGRAGSYSFVAGQRNALLLHVAPSAGLYTPSAGYTFSWTGTGNGFGIAVKRWRVEEVESDRIEGNMWYDQQVVSSVLGEFFSNAVAA